VVWAYASLGQGDRAQALYRLLNPIYHSDTPEKIGSLQNRALHIAADIYSVPPHTGNGGWTGYNRLRRLDVSLGMEAFWYLKSR